MNIMMMSFYELCDDGHADNNDDDDDGDDDDMVNVCALCMSVCVFVFMQRIYGCEDGAEGSDAEGGE